MAYFTTTLTMLILVLSGLTFLGPVVAVLTAPTGLAVLLTPLSCALLGGMGSDAVVVGWLCLGLVLNTGAFWTFGV